MLVATGVVVWPALREQLAAVPFLDSIVSALPSSSAPAWPLTGVPVAVVPDRPALAVKIENSVDARPQTGLDAADVVWEQVVEGGITRFVAVYHSTLPPEVGPVRSIRPMDPAIAAPLGGLLAFSGGVPAYVSAAQDAGLQVLSQDTGADGFSRTSTRTAPHNVYAVPQTLVDQADAAHRAAPAVQFDHAGDGLPTAAAEGQPAERLDLTLSGVSHPRWAWSAADGRWLRSEGSAPAVEADGRRVGAANVVVLRVDVVATEARDPAGNPVPETILTGTGRALVASGGHTIEATWSKPDTGDRVTLTGADGDPVELAPGSTWVELVPNGGGAVTTG
ncbi:DUF3048 domain-containing protein [Geodermatophilus sabuli]|uniref:DUF3048 domain-containing protein n=1 Tax=Geodermatophilus sabuli TaxID=1564158 RepID=A0A285EF38_9ACTN|nr:DUF3048 domain-containing protein [Geodermatophilus sabuli]MBB3086673.1 hypothetical protein [Geodermatophilus sabuli]SNX97675.1 Protein of unknown function [Geodermatophilus sabuli]